MRGNETCNANEAKNRSSIEIPIISENLQPKISEFLKSASQGILEKVLRGKFDKPVETKQQIWKPGSKPRNTTTKKWIPAAEMWNIRKSEIHHNCYLEREQWKRIS
eukprot:GHVP01048278.1.p1 GENE.GHVP01048278.1~~GHVP01048278.1.p1  ORF type:complete len:106 (+),score=21.26 GHVP01048278.1:309-626(+)